LPQLRSSKRNDSSGRHEMAGTRITPTAIFRCLRSGYFRRAFSASCFVLNGSDNTFGSRSTYSNDTQRTEIFMQIL
jgi:hypothetical protein